MRDNKFKIKIRFDANNVLLNLAKYRKAVGESIVAGIEYASNILLQDCRPYVPMLSGALRDSGKVVYLENFAFKLVWNAANPSNNYVYAKRQYEEVFQHVDGRYAAKWVEKTLAANPYRYTFLAAFRMRVEMQKLFGV